MNDKNTIKPDPLRRYGQPKKDAPKVIGTPEQREVKKRVRDRLDELAYRDDDPLID